MLKIIFTRIVSSKQCVGYVNGVEPKKTAEFFYGMLKMHNN